ncbi:MAG TPA: sialate O-acetylesterase [Chitinophagaceae bacterium]|jgi:sialate O-acetylesterase|nr:sialate O-acetylesterase [Chitinophagaceae bacterium]
MNWTKLLLLFLACCCTQLLRAADAFSLANTLQSGMVVQQGKPLAVWGKASPGTRLKVHGSWSGKGSEAVTGKDGTWMVEVPVPAAKPGVYTRHTLRISSGTTEKVLQNILIGEVWLCSGQSNMDMELKPFLPWLLGTDHYRMEIENAGYPEIRLFNVRTDFKAVPQEDCGGSWYVCSPATAPGFSAVAYFFARQVFLKKRIPVGLVVSSVGGSSGEAWVSRDTLAADPVLFQKYLHPYDTGSRSKEALDSVVTFEKVVRPTLFYNAMIHPLKRLQFTGALWYQGESNRFDSSLYTRLCASLVRNWRALFRQAQLPFYYVQVAPYNWGSPDATQYEYALLREAQAKIREVVPFTEMVVTMDIADPADIHPRNKQEVGYRLSRIAIAQVYGEPNTLFKGPEFAGYKKEGALMKVRFDHTGSGLVTNDGLPPRHFYLAGSDGVFHAALARIEGDEVWLQSEKVPDPVAVRYAFTNAPITNLENKEGFPAVPFRSQF